MYTELNPITKEFFTIYYGQAMSPNSEYVAVSNNFGQVFAVPITSKVDSTLQSSSRQLLFDSNVYALATVKNANLLLCGSETGTVQAYNWQDVLKHEQEPTTERFTVNINAREVNSICLINDETCFVSGYGDGNLTVQDLERPEKSLLELSGHTDQVNQVIPYQRNQFVTCSSNGTVHLYDLAAGPNPVRKINVSKNKQVLRPDHSGAVLTIALHDKFILCGGGIELSQFDISSGSLLQVFSSPKHDNSNYNINYIEVSLEKIGVGTSHGSVLGFSHAGHLVNEIPVSYGPVLNLNSIVDDKFRHTRTVASGVGSKISLIINHGYVSDTLQT